MKTVQLMALSFSLIEALPREANSGEFSPMLAISPGCLKSGR